MFSLREFIKKGLLDAVGKMADYQVILNAAGWLEKGVLTEEDLGELQVVIESQYTITEEPGDEGEDK
jgi:hypothetical protein